MGKAATDVPAETLLGSDQATAKVLATDQPRNLKQNAVITLFNRPEGTTIDAIMKATGWQQHSVRGFFSGVVRKRLRLNLISEKTESGRIYRIASKPAAGKRKFRCATYTRKSSEEGLEQDFNSLQTQREACEAYITSQRHEGWKALSAANDDSVYSNGTMEHPALKQLLADVTGGKVDRRR